MDTGAMDASFHHLYGSLVFEESENDGPLYQPALTRQNSFIQHATIVHAAFHNATKHPNKVLLQWVNISCKVVESITYQKLWDRARAVAAMLHQKGVQRGDRVMISYPPGLEFMVGLIGCMIAGAIACSVYPPNLVEPSKTKYSLQQFRNQVNDAGAKFALTTREFRMLVKLRALGRTRVTWLVTENLVIPEDHHLQLPNPGDVALIQYSSGSTGEPKGVMLSHQAIIHNVCAISRISADMTDANLHGVNWMPQYHDYGLFNFFFPAVLGRFWTATCASPIDFIRNPLLWADMIENFKATHTAGPNFAYGLLAKRMKQANRMLSKEAQRRLVRANIAAEPISPKTIEDMEGIIGFSRSAINPSYGLAESCVYVTSCVGPEVRILDGAVSCGMLERTKHYNKGLVIVDDPTKGTIAPDGQVGEIFIRGPDLALGYWNKPELDHLFHKRLDDGMDYMGTGDLGKVVDGRLYVVGRVKELIIQNGRNIYPTDIERTIEENYANVVRPGSTVAFQWSDNSICLVAEIREESASGLDEMSDHAMKVLLRVVHGVELGAIYLLRKGSVPKTTSGKVKRVQTKQDAFGGIWDKKSRNVIRKWKLEGPVLAAETTAAVSHSIVPQNLPSDKLPTSAYNVVSLIQFNPETLDGLFRELYLHEVEELEEAWGNADKSLQAFQSMCIDSIRAIEANLPSLVQFFHWLEEQPEKIVHGNPLDLLSDIAHAAFVMQWATTLLASDIELLQKKVLKDKEIEQRFTECLQKSPVPNEALFLTKGDRFDPLFGALDCFGWMKHRSVQCMMDQMVSVMFGSTDTTDIDFADGVDYATMNILEAVWIDRIFRRLDNAFVGSWLTQRSRPVSTEVVGSDFYQDFDHDEFAHVYKVWNLAFSFSLPDTKWVVAKLLMPCVAQVHNKSFTQYRMISLHMASHHWVRAHLSGTETTCKISREGQLALGMLNRQWLQSLCPDTTARTDLVESEPSELVLHWSARFQKIDSARRNLMATRFLQDSAPMKEDTDPVEHLFMCLMGNSIDMASTWEENGLTSLMHAELTNTVAEEFSLTLPPTFPMVFRTPAELKVYIHSQAKSCPA
ncbi:D-alanine--D-alanyl carrier protein ligase [Seminavis robusta]|uniref:D-alanine--D-alanyl carrier protein ligase n=1 Tax=Seminavis robusta TaxID=568900 RepID=A0A9N8EAX4_9STRA|nr:D-alanine--D-alanyl carrier protein ligase [Seminavis robusta]|eukprot:Sro742_g195930.1 D-alanine--D-alanyl carrier protein ligase (1081) ;mRNA; r:25521-28853